MGRDILTNNDIVFIDEFQSTRPRGARPTARRREEEKRWFQSTRPRGARHNQIRKEDIMWMFQSTRPRGARPWSVGCLCNLHPVSIHAPAWGATDKKPDYQIEIDRFNPRARVGRDPAPLCMASLDCAFQSTRPRGARPPIPVSACRSEAFQSTRPRGARLNSSSERSFSSGFNPRARVGRDVDATATAY